MEEVKELINEKSAAFGAVIGAFCGDAAGGVLEFLPGKIDPERVEKALKMPGGGQNFGLGPGQITDDSELAMCILHGVLDSGDKFDLNNIVKYYGKWYQSHPFGNSINYYLDMGGTIRKALAGANPIKPDAQNIKQRAIKFNKHSISNGSLMRITPLIFWARNLDDQSFAQVIREDASLSHSNPTAQDATIVYSIGIKYLINQPGNRKLAYSKAK